MVERFNGRVASEVLCINVAGHADLEILLTSFNHPFNRRRQRNLEGCTPVDKVEHRLKPNSSPANPLYNVTAKQSDLVTPAGDILYYAYEVSQPES